MAKNLDLLINAKWLGGGQVNKAGSDLRRLGNNASKSSKELVASGKATGVSLSNIATKAFVVTAAITALAVAAKKTYATIREGAELQVTQKRFDRLATAIGTTSKALSDDLGAAVRGLKSDIETTALATDLMVLGLAKSHDEAVRLTSVAAQLGFNMNQLVLTLTNQTTMRFDALGISIDGFAEKVDRLEAAGFAADEAFKFAFLEQSEEAIELVGSRADTTAGQLDILESAWQNNIDALKGVPVAILEPIIDKLASMIVAANDAETAVRALGDSLGDLNDQEAAVRAVADAISEIGAFGSPFATGATVKTREALLALAVQLASTGETLEEQQQILRGFGFTVDDIGVKLNGMGVSWIELQKAIEQVRLGQLAEDAADADRKFSFLNNTVEETTSLIEGLNKLIEKFETEDANEFLERAGVSIEVFTNLAEAMGSTAEAVEFLELVMKDAGQVTDDFNISAAELADIEELRQDKLKDRAALFLDFQTDLTDISVREGEQRAEAEATFEERRTEIVRDFGQRRMQEEMDWQRRRERSERKHQQSLDKNREDSEERQNDLREQANKRLSTLEQDHLDRMREIIENADLDLADAASRLDAKAVASIIKRREDALEDETESYQKQKEAIQRELQERLKAEQESAKERLQELQDFHEQRLRDEEEDRQIRLKRQQEEHEERLRELAQQKRDRLNEIRIEASARRLERERGYRDERLQLDHHLRDSSLIMEQWRRTILDAEEEWWRQRAGLVGGGASGGGGSAGGADGDGGTKPSRSWLESTALNIANPDSTESAIVWMNWIKSQSDAQLASWIERHSNIDVPGYARGGLVTKDTLALVGEKGPELVGLPAGAQVFSPAATRQMLGGANIQVGDIIVNEAQRPGDTAKEVRRELTKVFEELSA